VDFQMTIWGTIIAIALFSCIGVWLFVQSFRPDPTRPSDPRESRGRTFREAVQRYVGPVSPDTALLTPVLRVLLEAVSTLCGFPGFGWMASTRVAVGLPMLCIGPAIIYGFYPVLLAMTGHLSDSPFVAFQYLPYLAAISASALAVAEIRAARGGRDAA
jgi:hypothetical protein